jgi:hypothetical protein
LAPFRNIDARLATALDIDLAAAFDVTDLFFPVRVRFIMYPTVQSLLAYASHMVTSRCIRLQRRPNFVVIGGVIAAREAGPRRMPKLCFPDLLGTFGDFETSLDVGERLWSWDGWDSNPGPKP